MVETAENDDKGQLFYIAGWIVGGLSLGFGVVHLLWSLGYEGGPLAENISAIGASGIDDLGLLGPANYSFGFIAFGLVLMVFLNSSAWKRTGGY